MNLTIVTHYLRNYQELANITSASKYRYAKRYGYEFHEQIENYGDLRFGVQRAQIIYDLFFRSWKSPDIIWWTGCDTLITNHFVPVINFITDPSKSLFIHKDRYGLNDDSFIIRKTEWTKRFLEFTLEKARELDDPDWCSQKIWQEYVEKDEWKDGLAILDHPGINSYLYAIYGEPNSKPGDFRRGHLLLHLPALDMNNRISIFNSVISQGLVLE